MTKIRIVKINPDIGEIILNIYFVPILLYRIVCAKCPEISWRVAWHLCNRQERNLIAIASYQILASLEKARSFTLEAGYGWAMTSKVNSLPRNAAFFLLGLYYTLHRFGKILGENWISNFSSEVHYQAHQWYLSSHDSSLHSLTGRSSILTLVAWYGWTDQYNLCNILPTQ